MKKKEANKKKENQQKKKTKKNRLNINVSFFVKRVDSTQGTQTIGQKKENYPFDNLFFFNSYSFSV